MVSVSCCTHGRIAARGIASGRAIRAASSQPLFYSVLLRWLRIIYRQQCGSNRVQNTTERTRTACPSRGGFSAYLHHIRGHSRTHPDMLIRVVAPKGAGSSPVGHPFRFRIGKANTWATKRCRIRCRGQWQQCGSNRHTRHGNAGLDQWLRNGSKLEKKCIGSKRSYSRSANKSKLPRDTAYKPRFGA